MFAPRIFACVGILAFSSALHAQTPPTAYTITQAIAGSEGATTTIYRSGSQVVFEYKTPAKPDGTKAQHSYSFNDLKTGVTHTWDPSISPPSCSAGKFSGDWGDPFAMTSDLAAAIAKGDLKPAGAETLYGIPTKIYAGATQETTGVKIWLDQKDSLVIKYSYAAPGTPMTTLVDIHSISFAPPPASLFNMPAYCASVKPPPTSAELIADETGDDAANYVQAYGSSSKNSCSIIIRVVAAKTMAPVTRKWQAAIDTTFNVDSPSPYTFGVGDDGTSTFSGGHIHEITSQIHNDMLRIDNPPAYFNLALNVVQPHRGTASTVIYRQCFAPVTMLYYVMKDPTDIGAGADFLYAKSGKYATVPTH